MNNDSITYNRDEQYLLSNELFDWGKKDTLEQFLSYIINYIETKRRVNLFYPESQENGCGRPSFHPLILNIHFFGETKAQVDLIYHSALHV